MKYSGHHSGDVIIRAGDDCIELTSVGGGLYIWADGTTLPELSSVGREMYIDAEHVSLPALVKGDRDAV